MIPTYCRDCNASDIRSRKEIHTNGSTRYITIYYYCRDCNKILGQESETEEIKYYPREMNGGQ